MLEAGKSVIVLSCGALLPRPDLLDLAKAKGGRIIVPTGALLGLDAVVAAAEGEIASVRMTTRKPPGGLKGAPYLEKNGISVDGLTEAKRVFSGSAREAAASSVAGKCSRVVTCGSPRVPGMRTNAALPPRAWMRWPSS